MNYLFSFLISFFAGWTVGASDVLFREENRPGIFGGSLGTLLLLVLTGIGGLFAAGGFLWAFQAVPSAAVLIVIAGGGWLGFAASNRLHVNAAGAINRLIVGVAGLLILYALTWSLLPPAVDF
jgi:hypothetical protein